MVPKTLVRLLGLGLLATLLLATEAGFAQKSSASSARKTTVTDAAGRTHTRPSGHISDAQRKAAAKHRKALRSKHVSGGNKKGGKR
jgi:hypothetical protein